MPAIYYVHGRSPEGKWHRSGPHDIEQAKHVQRGFERAGYSNVTVTTGTKVGP